VLAALHALGGHEVSRAPIKAKSVRVSDELWRAAQAKADQRGEVLSEEIRKFLERYVKAKR
jgi:hypothetical protein